MALLKFPTKAVNTDGVNPFVNSVFDNLFNDSFITDRLVTRIPAVNITELETAFEVEFAAPGLQKSDFKINVDKNIISISVEKSGANASEGKLYSQNAFSYKSSTRSFTLPDTVDYSNIDASYEYGSLKSTIATPEGAMTAKRVIEV